ncbi:hypothetical protein [Microbacterium sp. NPDC055665]
MAIIRLAKTRLTPLIIIHDRPIEDHMHSGTKSSRTSWELGAAVLNIFFATFAGQEPHRG